MDNTDNISLGPKVWETIKEMSALKYQLRRLVVINLILLILGLGILTASIYKNSKLAEQVRLQQWAIEYLEGKEGDDALER